MSVQFPKKVIYRDVEYVFDQERLEESLLFEVNNFKEFLLKKASSEEEVKLLFQERERLRKRLAFVLLAAAQYGGKTPEIDAILDEFERNVTLANEPVPDGILFPDAWLLSMAFFAFADNAKHPPDTLGHLEPGRFAMMAGIVKQEIQ